MNAVSVFPDMANTTKFIYLRGQLSGKSYSLVGNLKVAEDTFDVAINMLDTEFLNRNEIFAATMNKFINSQTATSLESACEVVLNFKTQITELQKLNYDFKDNEASVELVSLILRSKLPKFFSIELGRLCNKANPNYMEICDKYAHIRQLLADKTDRKQPANIKSAASTNQRFSTSGIAAHEKPKPRTALTSKSCKFCGDNAHFSANCTKYSSPELRAKRAIQQNLCVRCLSDRHSEDNCQGRNAKIPFACKICNQHTHVTPMCKKALKTAIVSNE